VHRSDRIANACPPALVFTLVCNDFILTFLEWLVCLKPVSPVLLKLKYHCQYLSIVIQNMEYLVISASAMYIEPQLLSFHSYQERDFFSHWNHLMLFIYKKKTLTLIFLFKHKYWCWSNPSIFLYKAKFFHRGESWHKKNWQLSLYSSLYNKRMIFISNPIWGFWVIQNAEVERTCLVNIVYTVV